MCRVFMVVREVAWGGMDFSFWLDLWYFSFQCFKIESRFGKSWIADDFVVI